MLILEDYRKINELDESLVQLQKKTDAIGGQSSHLNVEFFQQECKEQNEKIGKFKIVLKREEIGRGVK